MPLSKLHVTLAILNLTAESREDFEDEEEKVSIAMESALRQLHDAVQRPSFWITLNGVRVLRTPCGEQVVVSEVHHGSHQLSFLRSIIVDRLAGSLADPRYRPHVTFYRNAELSMETRSKLENAGRNQFQGAWDMVTLELRVKKSLLSSPLYRNMKVGRYLKLSDPAYNWHAIPGKPGGPSESKKW